MLPEWLVPALSAVGGAFGAYVAVRVEMAVQRERQAVLRRDVNLLLNRAGLGPTGPENQT